MSKMVVRLEKMRRRDIVGRGKHNSRTASYLSERIDKSKTVYNHVLIGSNDAVEDILMDIDGCDMARGKIDGENDVAAELVLSFSPEWMGGKSSVEILADEQFQCWIDTSLKVLRGHGCIHADLHMDEATPHIHAICSVKTERKKTTKRDRSKKSSFVLNYGHFWGETGDKKTRDFLFAAGKVSTDPKRLAAVEKRFGMKYNPEMTRCGQLQAEFFVAYKDAGLDLQAGDSVLTTQKRHVTLHQHAIDQENKNKIAEYQQKSEQYRAAVCAKIDAETTAAIDAERMAADAAIAQARRDRAEAEQAAAEAEELRKREEKEKAEIQHCLDELAAEWEAMEAVRAQAARDRAEAEAAAAEAEAMRKREEAERVEVQRCLDELYTEWLVLAAVEAQAARKRAEAEEEVVEAEKLQQQAAEAKNEAQTLLGRIREFCAHLLGLEIAVQKAGAFLRKLSAVLDQKFRAAIWREAADVRRAAVAAVETMGEELSELQMKNQ